MDLFYFMLNEMLVNALSIIQELSMLHRVSNTTLNMSLLPPSTLMYLPFIFSGFKCLPSYYYYYGALLEIVYAKNDTNLIIK